MLSKVLIISRKRIDIKRNSMSVTHFTIISAVKLWQVSRTYRSHRKQQKQIEVIDKEIVIGE